MKLKKLLALLVALIMSVCVFAACEVNVTNNSDKNDEKTEEKNEEKNEEKKEEPAEEKKEEKKELSDEEAVEEVVDSFVTCLFSGDEEALDYLAEEGPKDEVEPLIEQMAMIKDFSFEAIGMDTSELTEDELKQAEDIMGRFIDELFDSIDVTVESVEIDGEEATAEMKMTMMNMDVFVDVASELSATDDFDAAEDVLDELIEEAKQDPMEETGTCELVKEDGEWKISNMI